MYVSTSPSGHSLSRESLKLGKAVANEATELRVSNQGNIYAREKGWYRIGSLKPNLARFQKTRKCLVTKNPDFGHPFFLDWWLILNKKLCIKLKVKKNITQHQNQKIYKGGSVSVDGREEG